LPCLALAEKNFSLKGEITNPQENRVIITIYRNWVTEPEDYYVYLDKKNRFSFQMALSESAYLDLNYGLHGVLFQIIEPGDEIFVKFDNENFYKSYLPTGKGSSKWAYDLLQKKKFEIERDVEKEITNLFQFPENTFMKAVKSYEDEQLDFLNSFKGNFSEQFFVLKRADILGKMNQLRLDYLSPRASDPLMPDKFNLSEIHPLVQSKSFEYGNFVESLCEVQMLRSGIFEKGYDLTKSYLQLKYFFEKDWISKEMADRLLASKLNASFLIDGYTEDAEALVRDYEKFVSNESIGKEIAGRFAVLRGKEKGEQVPSFTLEDTDGHFVSLKDLKGKYVIMLFWASWCEPCKADLAAMPAVVNYFKGSANLLVLQVAVDEARYFDKSMASKAANVLNVRIDPQSKLLTNLDIKTIPSIVLIDKSGNWLESKLIEPGLDEGRGLIRQLEAIFANQ
jgi:peroxiredoxin